MQCQLQECQLHFEAKKPSYISCAPEMTLLAWQVLQPASSHFLPWKWPGWRGPLILLCSPPLCSPAPLPHALQAPAGDRPLAGKQQQPRGKPARAAYGKTQPRCLLNRLHPHCAITGWGTPVISPLRARAFRGNWRERNTHQILLQIIWKAQRFPSSSFPHDLQLLIVALLPGSSWQARLSARSVCTQLLGRPGLLAGFPGVLAFPAAWCWGNPNHPPAKGWYGQAGSVKCRRDWHRL